MEVGTSVMISRPRAIEHDGPRSADDGRHGRGVCRYREAAERPSESTSVEPVNADFSALPRIVSGCHKSSHA